MEKCYENLLKYFVFLCNLIFALAGACLVGFGAYVQVWSSHLILNWILKTFCTDQLWRTRGIHRKQLCDH